MKFERKLTITLDRLVCVVQTQIPLLLTAAWRTSLPGSVVMLLQGSLETSDKAVPVEGLGQITNRPGTERLRTNPLIGEGREENERHAVTLDSKWACNSTPLMPGIWTSAITHERSSRLFDRRNSSADANVCTM